MAKSKSANGSPRSVAPARPGGGRVNVHVDLRDGAWVVRVRRSIKSTHETRQQAIDAALELAQRTEVDVAVHSTDGRVQYRLSGSIADKLMFEMWKSIRENPELWEF
ncbi:MAG: hypothetical protein AVDCRST_MAG68-3714 [uncultured Gemmatimonadetes bacterium]|uniref:DUF2188 domain-containing protein n=1 Tax=uncultured Gemmatimonadota bacterium TaxID=203437 RepID=A0A6J4M9A7_9BACT|nr:MAG: hypothetical protein AVDCRST_MAG68-3714 [uncultured Gemmatimonadota bacterium]